MSPAHILIDAGAVYLCYVMKLRHAPSRTSEPLETRENLSISTTCKSASSECLLHQTFTFHQFSPQILGKPPTQSHQNDPN